MSRVTFNRFKAAKPAPELLNRYLKLFSSKDIHFQPDSLAPIFSPSLFANNLPLYLDLGCGVGDYTTSFALTHPDANIIGIDLHFKSLYYAINQLALSMPDNLLFARSDLRSLLQLVPDSSVHGAFLLFPPPPTKPNLEKRHFFNSSFAHEIHRLLKPGGNLVFVSDNHQYLNQKTQLFSPSQFTIEPIQDTSVYSTRFHQKWIQKGITTIGNIITKRV